MAAQARFGAKLGLPQLWLLTKGLLNWDRRLRLLSCGRAEMWLKSKEWLEGCRRRADP